MKAFKKLRKFIRKIKSIFSFSNIKHKQLCLKHGVKHTNNDFGMLESKLMDEYILSGKLVSKTKSLRIKP